MNVYPLNEVTRRRLDRLAHALRAHRATGGRNPQSQFNALRAGVACMDAASSVADLLAQLDYVSQQHPGLAEALKDMHRQAWQTLPLNDGLLSLIALPLIVRCAELPEAHPGLMHGHGPSLQQLAQILCAHLKARRVVMNPGFHPEWVADASRFGHRGDFMRHCAHGGLESRVWAGWRAREKLGKVPGRRWQCLWLLGVAESDEPLCNMAGDWLPPPPPTPDAALLADLVGHASLWPQGAPPGLEVRTTGWDPLEQALPKAGHEHRSLDLLDFLQRTGLAADTKFWLEQTYSRRSARLMALSAGACHLLEGADAWHSLHGDLMHDALHEALRRAFGGYPAKVQSLASEAFEVKLKELAPQPVIWRRLPLLTPRQWAQASRPGAVLRRVV
jgi:hypothetical protein